MSQRCEKCGASLPEAGAACRRCLMELAVHLRSEGGVEPVSSGVPRPGTPPPQPEELAPLFPDLELEGLVGAGGMGAVYRARQKKLGRAVALKVLHRELSGEPVFVERFLREAQALAKLNHPGIVAVYDFGEREKRCYLVMEFVDGTNLRGLLKGKLLAPRQALDIVRQLCDALQFAHDEGVVHRDIKPENVLVDRAGKVKIADFGLAKLVGVSAEVSLTEAGQVMGTPHYMAPEQVEHPRDVDHRADLFSLGVVFYEMLTGELPLGRFAPPSERVKIDVRLDEIVLKSLERERERRYQHAAQVKTDVERCERSPAEKEDRSEVFVGTPRLRSGVYLPRLRAALGRHEPTKWGWLVLCGFVWVLAGVCFNVGPWAFALLGAPVLTWTFVSLVMQRAGTTPAPDEEHGRWVMRLPAGPFFTALLGIGALTVMHLALWERFTWSYAAGAAAAGPGQLESRLEAFASLAGITTRPAELKLVLQEMHTTSGLAGISVLLAGACALALLIGGGLWAAAPGSTVRAGLLATARALALFLTPLVAWHAADLIAHRGQQSLAGVHASQVCEGTAAALTQNLRTNLVERELGIDWSASAELVERASGLSRANVSVVAASPAPFEAVNLGWTGPVRWLPRVLFTIVSDPDGRQAHLVADGGLAARGWNTTLAYNLDQWLREVSQGVPSASPSDSRSRPIDR